MAQPPQLNAKANTAAITIENSGGGTDLIQIATEEGQTQFAGFTIPTGKTGYLMSAAITVDSAKARDFRMFTRANPDDASAPVNSKRLRLFFDGIGESMTFQPRSPLGGWTGLTDVWWEARAGATGGEVSVDFELLLVDD